MLGQHFVTSLRAIRVQGFYIVQSGLRWAGREITITATTRRKAGFRLVWNIRQSLPSSGFNLNSKTCSRWRILNIRRFLLPPQSVELYSTWRFWLDLCLLHVLSLTFSVSLRICNECSQFPVKNGSRAHLFVQRAVRTSKVSHGTFWCLCSMWLCANSFGNSLRDDIESSRQTRESSRRCGAIGMLSGLCKGRIMHEISGTLRSSHGYGEKRTIHRTQAGN